MPVLPAQTNLLKLPLLTPKAPRRGPGPRGRVGSDRVSPVGRGGIQDGDIIVKVNGRPLGDSSELQEAVLTESPLLLEVRRGNDDLLFSIAPEVVL